MSYDWQAALAFLATLVGLTLIGRFVAFLHPDLQHMRDLNRAADRKKLEREKVVRTVKATQRAGLVTNGLFLFAVLPFCIDLAPRPLWRHAVDIVAVLMIFDFFYYLTHRFVFHGKPLLRVHAIHHQALEPTYIDAHYVHPLETTIGLVLFLGSIPLVAVLAGGPLNGFSMAVATLLFTQLNTLNHTYVDLPYFPFKTLNHITSIHAAHHVNMSRGNYATLTMLYDWLFGTLEEPVSRESA